jgi:hypothetical protein
MKTKKTSVESFGDAAIDHEVFNFIRQNLKDGSTILELGSGWGTHMLAQHYNMVSIESSKKWLNRYKSTYIYAPIVKYDDSYPSPDLPKNTGWYNINNIIEGLPAQYDAILVDGPLAKFGRGGFYKHLNAFNTDVMLIFDDIDRAPELALAYKVATELGRELVFINNYCTAVIFPKK